MTTPPPRLRVLWCSDHPSATSGYSVETALAARHLKEHCDLALLATFGLHGSIGEWEGIPLFPGGADAFANDVIPKAARLWQADIVITLKDSIVFRPEAFQGLRWLPMCPIDHDPSSPIVIDRARSSYRPIAYAPHGFRALRKAGLDPLYAPHACFDYDAKVAVTKDRTEKLGDIATGKVQVDSVLGVGRDGRIRSVRVTNKYVIPHKDKYAVAVKTQSGKSFIATRDNDILTDQGWVPAGLLDASMYVIMGNIHSDERQAHERTMVTGRNSVAEGAFCYSQQARNRSTVPGSDVLRGSSIRTARTGSDQDIRDGFRRETQSNAPNTNTRRTSLSGGNIRWRRTFLATEKQPSHTRAQADSAVYTACGGDQSIGSVDRMDVGTPDLVTTQDSHRQVGMGMGISSDNHWTRSIRVSQSSTPLSSDQGRSSTSADGVLRTEGCGRGECSDWRTGRGDMVGTSGIEWSEELTRDAITSVIPVHLDTVYDLTTETSNFLVDGVVVHNCDPKVYYPMPQEEARKVFNLSPDLFIIGTVAVNRGGVPSRKAWAENIEAFARFAQGKPNARYFVHTDLADDGYEGGLPLRQLMAHFGVLDKVMFCDQERYRYGGFPPEYMRAYYNSINVLNAVSLGEGFGIPALEAQACGRPVIVGDWCAHEDLCFAGWKVDKDEAHHLYDNQQGWVYLPRPGAIAARMEDAYGVLPADADLYRKVAVEGAAPYQIETVIRDHWLPLLAEVERDIRAPRSRGVVRIIRPEEVFA